MLSRLDLRGCADLAGALAAPDAERPTTSDDAALESVRAIIADVRRRGDAAVRELTERFDGCTLDDLRVPADELRAALDAAAPELRAALDVAADRIREYHAAQLAAPEPVLERDGVMLRETGGARSGRAGLYVPGGRAAYPSTVLMTAIPAQLAGVGELVLCVPPAADGTVPASHAGGGRARRDHRGVSHRRRAGDRRARVRHRVHPPGRRHRRARQPLRRAGQARGGGHGRASTPSPGPSEVVVVADGSVPAVFAAADLLAQAEHGPGGSAVLVTWDTDVADAVDAAVDDLLVDAPRQAEITATLATGGRIVLVDDALAALDAVNVIAPEHLELLTADPARAGAARAQRGRGVRRSVGAGRAGRLPRRA